MCAHSSFGTKSKISFLWLCWHWKRFRPKQKEKLQFISCYELTSVSLSVFFCLFHQFLFFEVKSRRWFDLWTGRWNLWWWKNFRASTQVWFSPINLCLFFFLLMSITRTKGILGATKGFSVYDYWGLFLSRSSCWKERKVIFSLRFFFPGVYSFMLNCCLRFEYFLYKPWRVYSFFLTALAFPLQDRNEMLGLSLN